MRAAVNRKWIFKLACNEQGQLRWGLVRRGKGLTGEDPACNQLIGYERLPMRPRDSARHADTPHRGSHRFARSVKLIALIEK